jgi:SAM-dependent methyltransferase
MPITPEDIQRRYYATRAPDYNAAHVTRDEHYFALGVLDGLIDQLSVTSVLDVGAGTGRALLYLRERRPQLRLHGVEPVTELREVAYAQDFPAQHLTDGDALDLPFQDGAFDLVCAFGMLHHIRTPERAVAEMLRVAKRAVFISDCNNFGQGTWAWRTMKQTLHALRLWPVADWIKTRGKGYQITDGDGLAYSYSLFDTYRVVSRACKGVYIFNTVPAGPNPYRSATHVAVLGVKTV